MGKSSLCILLIFLSCSGNQSIKTYEEALQNAMNGVLDQEIIASFRRELINAEISGTVSYLVDVKINLAVSILQLANKVRDPSTYTNMYRESEEILLSALKLHPGHQGGTRNLASVRKNIELRREAHVQERSIPSDFSAFPVQQLTSQPSSTNIDEKIVDDVQSLNYTCMTGNPESFRFCASNILAGLEKEEGPSMQTAAVMRQAADAKFNPSAFVCSCDYTCTFRSVCKQVLRRISLAL